jgi:hypothetical protein
MKITNVDVFGLTQSIRRSGLPKMAEYYKDYIVEDCNSIRRAKNLGNAEIGSGHDCFLKGIIVEYDLTLNHAMLVQWQRYHFHDIISSQSKMHMILNMDIEEHMGSRVTNKAIENMQECIDEYMLIYYCEESSQEELMEQFEVIIENTPLGFELTMGCVANYLQLKSIYFQRRNHKMSYWREFCRWIETLPMFKELILGG